MEFPGVLGVFLALKFSRGVTQFCGISRGEALFLLGNSNGKESNLQVLGFFQKSVSSTPLFVSFLEQLSLCHFKI